MSDTRSIVFAGFSGGGMTLTAVNLATADYVSGFMFGIATVTCALVAFRDAAKEDLRRKEYQKLLIQITEQKEAPSRRPFSAAQFSASFIKPMLPQIWH